MNNSSPKLSHFLILFFILQIIIITSCSEKKKELEAPKNLRVEYQHNPLGIDVMEPRLFWEVNDLRRGAVQSAYQILVSSSVEKLETDEADIWNSGKVESDQSAHVVYSGSKLQSRKNYYWKVKTWDDSGKASAYSMPANWEMGILSENEWSANWIGNEIFVDSKKEENKWKWTQWFWHPTEIGINTPVYFRKKVIIPASKKVTSAIMRLTADNKFTAYFNDTELGSGKSWQNIYDFDVTDKIKNENIIAIDAANTAGNVCGLLFSIKISFDDGNEIYIGADKDTKDWKTSNKKFSNWTKLAFNDSKWGKIKLLGDYETGQWEKVDEQDEYIAPRPILVRNEIKIEKSIKSARAYVTGLGGYVMHINGERVGDAVFTPGWTHYPKRIQYQTYDVSDMLNEGENAIGAVLGNLWWSSGLGWRGSISYSKGPLSFFAQVTVDYQDGSSQTFITDKNWKTHDAPIISTTLYGGEFYDARQEEEGWSKVDFDDSKWVPVNVHAKEKGKLVAQQGPLLRVTKEIEPVNITSPSKGVYIFDMGQNFAGWAKLKVKGERGTTVQMRFAETLKPDGNVYRDNLRKAEATDTYILKGDGEEEWQPDFTYHGYRYVEVTGYPGEPLLDALKGLVANSDAPNIGEFSCSNELLNKIQHNILWGQASNMYSVPTDCPQRDERLGWMGDAQAFAPTSSYNMEMINFFNKWMRDITDSQDDDGAVHDVNPVIVVKGPAAPGWGDAVFVVPWVMYKYYGDKRILEENYDAIVAWVDYMKSKSKGNLYEKSGYGDWVAAEKSPSEPIGSAYYFYGAKMVSTIAGLLRKDEDERKYKELSEKIAEAFNRKHFNSAKNTYTGNTQTANLIPLNFGIVPKEHKKEVAASIAENVIAKDNHLTTGFLGVSLLLPTLSDYGYNDLAFKVATQKTYPSWGYTVEKGATTIWELWNGDTEGPDMNSRNHFALGACGEWYYGYLAGIKPSSDSPGFKKIILSPMPAKDLDWVKADMKTAYGIVSSYWERRENIIEFNFIVPANTSAEFHLPFLGQEIRSVKENDVFVYQNGKTISRNGLKLIKTNDDEAIVSLAAGVYHFIVEYE
jgi:alpha-L-rhamnosidase